MNRNLETTLCAAAAGRRQASARRALVLAVLACTLGGCSYQLGSFVDESETTATMRPLPKGAVDPNPNDPYKFEPTSKSTVVAVPRRTN
jgi:hypothetical protein